jgi:hypothetical protein
VHSLAGDTNRNLFTGEVNMGKRLQKFMRTKQAATAQPFDAATCAHDSCRTR